MTQIKHKHKHYGEGFFSPHHSLNLSPGQCTNSSISIAKAAVNFVTTVQKKSDTHLWDNQFIKSL